MGKWSGSIGVSTDWRCIEPKTPKSPAQNQILLLKKVKFDRQIDFYPGFGWFFTAGWSIQSLVGPFSVKNGQKTLFFPYFLGPPQRFSFFKISTFSHHLGLQKHHFSKNAPKTVRLT